MPCWKKIHREKKNISEKQLESFVKPVKPSTTPQLSIFDGKMLVACFLQGMIYATQFYGDYDKPFIRIPTDGKNPAPPTMPESNVLAP